jgi:hypothetical protein
VTAPLYLARHDDSAWMLWEQGPHTYGIRLEGPPFTAMRAAAFVIWNDSARADDVRVLPPQAVQGMLEHLQTMPTLDQAVRAPAGLREWLRGRGRTAGE